MTVREFSTSIDLSNDIDYCLRPLETVKSTINKIYIGHNFMGSMLTELVDIVHRGPPVIRRDTSPGVFSVDVTFTALCITYRPGQILHDAIIIPVTGSSSLMAKNKYCSVTFKERSESLVVKSIMPVLINGVSHDPHRSTVTIEGQIWLPPKSYPVFTHTGEPIRQDIVNKIIEIRNLADNSDEKTKQFLKIYDDMFAMTTVTKGTVDKIVPGWSPGAGTIFTMSPGNCLSGVLMKDIKDAKAKKANVEVLLENLANKMEFIYNMALFTRDFPMEEKSRFSAMRVMLRNYSK